jgi:hypothetical protein
MNYVKSFKGTDEEVMAEANAFLKEADEHKHRVMATKFFHRNDQFVLFVVVNDEPHPHKQAPVS